MSGASHRFLDEVGDTTFFAKGKIPSVGSAGVSLAFGIGMLKINESLDEVRQKIWGLACEVERDPYLNDIPSVAKKIKKGGFHFHANDDPPEVRERFFKLIHSVDCTLQMVIARKQVSRFISKHNRSEAEFYADVLSHLIKDKFKGEGKLVLNVAERGSTTKNATLQKAHEKATERFLKKGRKEEISRQIAFNVQRASQEPLLCMADYLCWTIQRVFEKGEIRFYNYLLEKIVLVVDLYDVQNYEGWKNYYSPARPLTSANKLSLPSP